MEHQSCAHCEASLSGQRYVLRDEKPCCLACFDKKYANHCESCEKPIGTDFRDLSYKGRHWHEQCFKCWGCKNSLAGQQFVPRDDGLFCGDCFDNNFAQRCDVCTKTFKNGMKKYDYNGKKYHEECFLCSLCQKQIGNNSFVPREHDELACMACFEEKLAQRCAVCSQVLIKGGVMFQNLSYHKECFVCKGCNAELANMKFATKDDAQYCPDCYVKNFAKSCERCTKPIAGLGQATKYIAFEGRQWHAECFVCNRCDKALVGQGFVVLSGEVMCPECGNK